MSRNGSTRMMAAAIAIAVVVVLVVLVMPETLAMVEMPVIPAMRVTQAVRVADLLSCCLLNRQADLLAFIFRVPSSWKNVLPPQLVFSGAEPSS